MKKASFYITVSILLIVLIFDILSGKKIISGCELPDPGRLVKLSREYAPPCLRGMKFDPDNPLAIDFIFDPGHAERVPDEDKKRLIRYFLAGLALSKEKLWVNLSPAEPDRIIDSHLAQTDAGRVMLEQDYLLKQLSASLTHPDAPTGQKYWSEINSSSPIIHNSVTGDLSRIWIKPGRISVYDKNHFVYITDSELELDTDCRNDTLNNTLLPRIKKEVNKGKNFAGLRQLYSSIILAQYFKIKYSDSVYSYYINKEQTDSINTQDASLKEDVFKMYVKAFTLGAYDIIRKEDGHDKRFFSGGIKFDCMASSALTKVDSGSGLPDVPLFLSKTIFSPGKSDFEIFCEKAELPSEIQKSLESIIITDFDKQLLRYRVKYYLAIIAVNITQMHYLKRDDHFIHLKRLAVSASRVAEDRDFEVFLHRHIPFFLDSLARDGKRVVDEHGEPVHLTFYAGGLPLTRRIRVRPEDADSQITETEQLNGKTEDQAPHDSTDKQEPYDTEQIRQRLIMSVPSEEEKIRNVLYEFFEKMEPYYSSRNDGFERRMYKELIIELSGIAGRAEGDHSDDVNILFKDALSLDLHNLLLEELHALFDRADRLLMSIEIMEDKKQEEDAAARRARGIYKDNEIKELTVKLNEMSEHARMSHEDDGLNAAIMAVRTMLETSSHDCDVMAHIPYFMQLIEKHFLYLYEKSKDTVEIPYSAFRLELLSPAVIAELETCRKLIKKTNGNHAYDKRKLMYNALSAARVQFVYSLYNGANFFQSVAEYLSVIEAVKVKTQEIISGADRQSEEAHESIEFFNELDSELLRLCNDIIESKNTSEIIKGDFLILIQDIVQWINQYDDEIKKSRSVFYAKAALAGLRKQIIDSGDSADVMVICAGHLLNMEDFFADLHLGRIEKEPEIPVFDLTVFDEKARRNLQICRDGFKEPKIQQEMSKYCGVRSLASIEASFKTFLKRREDFFEALAEYYAVLELNSARISYLKKGDVRSAIAPGKIEPHYEEVSGGAPVVDYISETLKPLLEKAAGTGLSSMEQYSLADIITKLVDLPDNARINDNKVYQQNKAYVKRALASLHAGYKAELYSTGGVKSTAARLLHMYDLLHELWESAEYGIVIKPQFDLLCFDETGEVRKIINRNEALPRGFKNSMNYIIQKFITAKFNFTKYINTGADFFERLNIYYEEIRVASEELTKVLSEKNNGTDIASSALRDGGVSFKEIFAELDTECPGQGKTIFARDMSFILTGRQIRTTLHALMSDTAE